MSGDRVIFQINGRTVATSQMSTVPEVADEVRLPGETRMVTGRVWVPEPDNERWILRLA